MLNQFKKYQIFWNIAAGIYKFAPDKYFRNLPQAIFIETTNACNLRCPVCPTHFAMKREKGFMEFGLFKSIIDEFIDFNKKPEIFMHFAGEPLLNKEVDKIVAYTHQKGHGIHISTNATLLSKDLSHRLIKAGLTSIHLCLDGFSKESHEAYRVGSDFTEIKRNIENFLSVKQELGAHNPEACIQTLVTSFSENEMNELIGWAKANKADAINFKSLSMGSFTTDEIKQKYDYLLPRNNKWKRKTSKVYKTICSWPRDNAVIYWNGDLGLCCIDFDSKIKLPNIQSDGFIKTFTSDEVIKKRKLGLQKKFALCKRCSLGNADFMGININLKE